MYKIITGEALSVLQSLESNSVNCCITSPPYYGLRDYGMDGQIGLEETPSEYIEKLVAVFREVRRVLKKDGTLWLNMGDSYAGSGKGAAAYPDNAKKYKQGTNKGLLGASATTKIKTPEYKRKDLMGIPWRLAFALQADGWYLRQDIIWYKPNCMPESVKDRCTKSHEYIFLLSKSNKYYFDYEAIKEPAVGFNNIPPAGSRGTLTPNSRRRKGNSKTFRGGGAYTNNQTFDNSTDAKRESSGNTENTTGLRNKRDVWSVSTHGYKEAHFATFPEKLIEPCILAGCPIGGIVFDPFLGSGTTAVVSVKNKRNCIGAEINPTYADMAERRVKQEAATNE